MLRFISLIISALILNTYLFAQEPVKVGAILILSGEYAFIGRDIQAGMELRRAENSEIKIIYGDGKFDRRTAVSEYNKIATQGASLIFGSTMIEFKSLIPLSAQKKIPSICLWDSNRELDTESFAYSIGYYNEDLGVNIANFTYKKLNKKTASIIFAHDEYSEILTDGFVKQFKTLGGKILLQDQINIDDIDLRSHALKVKQHDADFVFLPIYGASLDSIVKRLHEINYQKEIILGEGPLEDTRKNLGSLLNGVYGAKWKLSEDDSAMLVEKLKKQNYQASNLDYVAIGYDGIDLVAKLAEKLRKQNKSFSRSSVNEALKGFNYTGLLGSIVVSKENQRIPKILKVENQELVFQE